MLKAFLRLNRSRPFSDPFLHLLLRANAAHFFVYFCVGRAFRGYCAQEVDQQPQQCQEVKECVGWVFRKIVLLMVLFSV